MPSIFYAIYDDSAITIPFKMVHKSPITVYRTSNMGLMEEISAMGFEPTAVLLEEDVESLKSQSYSNDDVTPEELEFLSATVTQWEFKHPQ